MSKNKHGSPRTVDIHAHIVPAAFPASPASCCDKWPGMHHHADGTASIMLGTREFRKLDNRSWSVPRRITDMDLEDVAIQALSPMPELLSYWIDDDATAELARHVNGAIATMVAVEPARFVGLAMVALQNPERAAGELARVKADGFAGVEIGSNILGRSPGDAHFDEFFAEAERLDLAIFVHALHPAAVDRIVGPKPLAAFIGFPTDVGLAAASCITGRLLEKFPRLKIAFSHGGGTLAAILPRLQNGWTLAPELNHAFASPVETARRFYYDNIVFDPATLRYLIASFGETQILAGSDYPYLAGQRFPGNAFEELNLPSETLENLLAINARHFLGLAAR